MNWINLTVLNLNNKKYYMFEAWIRLILNKYELYIYRILDKYFVPD